MATYSIRSATYRYIDTFSNCHPYVNNYYVYGAGTTWKILIPLMSNVM